MRGGLKAIMAGACLSATACVTDTGKLQVRTIADPANGIRAGAGDLAQARGLLALGNVGLALEAFRKVQREQPSSVEALSGIAACYAAMGRYDLTQSNYEAALALAPRDAKLLTALADSLDRQGKTSEAAKARTDANRNAGDSAPKPLIAGDKARLAATQVTGASTQSAPALSSSVTVQLPPPQPVEGPRTRQMKAEGIASPATSIAVSPPPASVADSRVPARAAATVQFAQAAAPRLERLSLAEVALVTTGKPMWHAQIVSRTRLSTTVRWVPIQSAASRSGIQLLNAARYAGLAARARNVLADRGWRGIQIGDAARVRESSIVYYPASRSALGRSLASQFGIRALMASETDRIIVLLGRDSAGLKAAERRG